MPDPEPETDVGLDIISPREERIDADVDIMAGAERPPDLAEPPKPHDGRPGVPLGVNPFIEQPGDFDDDGHVKQRGRLPATQIPDPAAQAALAAAAAAGALGRPAPSQTPLRPGDLHVMPPPAEIVELATYSVTIEIAIEGQDGTTAAAVQGVPPVVAAAMLRVYADQIEHYPARKSTPPETTT